MQPLHSLGMSQAGEGLERVCTEVHDTDASYMLLMISATLSAVLAAVTSIPLTPAR